MAPRGFNVQFRVHAMTTSDDRVGGAVSTGTSEGLVMGRIEPKIIPYFMLPQGFENIEIFQAEVQLNDVPIRFNDQMEIVSPTTHIQYGRKMIVRSVSETSMHPADPRAFRVVHLQNSRRSRSQP